jgi:hypothetical protein
VLHASVEATDPVGRLDLAAVVPDVVHPGVGITGDPVRGGGVGRVVEPRGGDRDGQAGQSARRPEGLALDHDVLGGPALDDPRRDRVVLRPLPRLVDLVGSALHPERVDVPGASDEADDDRRVVLAARAVDDVVEEEGLALGLRKSAELQPDEWVELRVLVDRCIDLHELVRGAERFQVITQISVVPRTTVR